MACSHFRFCCRDSAHPKLQDASFNVHQTESLHNEAGSKAREEKADSTCTNLRCDHTNVVPLRCTAQGVGVRGPQRVRTCLIHHVPTSLAKSAHGPLLLHLLLFLLLHALLPPTECNRNGRATTFTRSKSTARCSRNAGTEKMTGNLFEGLQRQNTSCCFTAVI